MRPIDQAIALHQSGRLAEAETIYRTVLSRDGRDFDALHMLGIVCAQRGQFEEAEQFLRQAVAVDARVPPCLNNYGNVLSRLKRYQDAIELYRQAIALAPNHAPLHSDLGNALQALERYDEALGCYDQAIAISPNFAAAHNNRGNALDRVGRRGEALASFDRALSLDRNDASAHCNRGVVLQALGRTAEALADYERAIALDPKFALAHSNRGYLLNLLGRQAEALPACELAVTLDPTQALAQANYAATLLAAQRYEDVVAVCDKALALDRHAKHVEGLRVFAKRKICDWSGFDQDASRLLDGVRGKKTVAVPFEFLAVTSSASEQLTCGQVFSFDLFPEQPKPLWLGERYAHQRIRIAYLSADLREHPVSHLMAGLFEQHDRGRFETFAYSYGFDDGSEMHKRVTQSFEHFADVRDRTPAEIAALIRQHEIDIVIDLMWYTKDARPGVLALRPAPIQVNYLGFPGTSGAPWIDYLIADDHVVPEPLQRFYSEKIASLPDCFQANDAKRPRPQTAPSRAELGLPEQGFVFCSFNNIHKLTPDVFAVWMRLLRKVDGSALWMFADNATAKQNLRRQAEAHGVDAKRIVFAPHAPYRDHLPRYLRADLFLDTLPFNAGATASDALWCGLPIVTCSGESFASRMAGSLLKAAGLPELIANSLDDYEALALKLAQSPEMLARARQKLAADDSPLFDTARFTRHFEAALTTMWQRHQDGAPPSSFKVERIGRV